MTMIFTYQPLSLVSPKEVYFKHLILKIERSKIILINLFLIIYDRLVHPNSSEYCNISSDNFQKTIIYNQIIYVPIRKIFLNEKMISKNHKYV
jgi:dolichyl-phosphate-mannose--protein O-mannosyl transferase